MLPCSLLLASLLLVAGRSISCEIDPSYPGWNNALYMFSSADTTTNISLSSVTPKVSDDYDMYLDSTSCLGYLGPIGCYGPLSSLGPIGTSLPLFFRFYTYLRSSLFPFLFILSHFFFLLFHMRIRIYTESLEV